MTKKKKTEKKVEVSDMPKPMTKEEYIAPAKKFAEENLTQEQIDNLVKVKDPYMAKDEEAWKELRQKQLDIKNSDLYKSKTFFVPGEAIINTPISGLFKQAIQDTLNYVFSTMKAEDLVKSLVRVQTGFKNLDSKELKPADMAVWTLLNLITEINFQAQEQGKLLNTDEQFGDTISDLIDNLDSDPNFEITPEVIDSVTKEYQSAVPGATEFKFVDEDSDTNED
jgi:hypothetical protein